MKQLTNNTIAEAILNEISTNEKDHWNADNSVAGIYQDLFWAQAPLTKATDIAPETVTDLAKTLHIPFGVLLRSANPELDEQDINTGDLACILGYKLMQKAFSVNNPCSSNKKLTAETVRQAKQILKHYLTPKTTPQKGIF